MHYVGSDVLNTVRKYNLISPGDSIIAGLSGGPDSVCLISVLKSLRDELGIGKIYAVHVNHGLRGQESDEDERYSRIIAEAAGAGFDSVYYDAALMASEQGISVEAMGRKLRYETFESFRKKYGAQKIAVAHNMNDRAETVLMRIIRGTGIRGLSGIEYKRDGVIIRPLLDTARSDIERYCSDMGLEPRIDSTNSKTIYTRNRIRLTLIPELEKEYNPRIKEALIRLADQAEEADGLVRSIAEEYIDGCDGSGRIRWNGAEGSLSLDGFDRLHPAAAKRVFLLCAGRMGLDDNISSANLQRMLDTALGGEPAEADVTMGCYVLRTYGRLWFLKRGETVKQIETAVPVPFEMIEKEGYASISAGNGTLIMTLDEWDGRQVKELRARGIAVLDYEKLKSADNASVRNRRAGDRIRPKGMKGSKKLQDFFTDRKIPRHMRDSMMLIADENRILLAGLETSDECAVDENTEKVLYVQQD